MLGFALVAAVQAAAPGQPRHRALDHPTVTADGDEVTAGQTMEVEEG